MPVLNVDTNLDNASITITAEFAAPIEQVWDIYADPRKLEKIWGPPSCPATFVEHSLVPGSRTTYYMELPEGGRSCGWWQVTAVDAPNSFTFDDGFADVNLQPLDDMPVSANVYSFTESGGVTRAVFTSTYTTAEGLQQVLDMGVIEGATAAINQVDGLLAA